MSLFGNDTPKIEKLDIWEEVGEDSYVYRTSVPEGWLVCYKDYHAGGVTFVPDVDHKWKLS